MDSAPYVSIVQMIARPLLSSLKTLGVRGVAVLALLVALPVASASAGEDRLRTIIQSIQQNEALYENLEVRWHTRFRIGKQKRPSPDLIATSDEDARSVSQAGLFYLNADGESEDLGGGTRSRQALLGFDGTHTRVFRQKAIGHIVKGRAEEHRMFRPHTALFKYNFVYVPLSTYLQGDEAIRAHPQGGTLADYHFIVKYLGEEECGGFTCQKVCVDYIGYATGKPVFLTRIYLWLAPQRNYLPLKLEGYNIESSAKLPVEVAVVQELRELSPGIWFPFMATKTSNDEYRIREDNEVVVAWQEGYAVQEAALNPHYPLSLFREITIPDGVLVYEIENGKIVRKYVQGEPEGPGTRPSNASARRWWIALLVSAGLAGILALIFRWRTRRA